MPKADSPCAVFSPGRSLPHNECECGWMRIDHGKDIHPIPIPTVTDVQEWKKIAEKEAELSHSYSSILTDIGQLFGTAAFVDGKLDFAKLPELVKDMLAVKGFHFARLPFPPTEMPLPAEQKAFLDAVATTGSKASIETVQIAGNPQTLYPLVEGNLPKKEK